MRNARLWLWGLLPVLLLWWFATQTLEPMIAADLARSAQAAAAARGESWVTAALAGRDADLTAQAPTAAAYDRALAILRGVDGVRLVNASGTVRPAPKPYVWKAEKTAKGVTLSGFAPDMETRDAIVAAAARLLGVTPESRLELADGAPGSLSALAGFALAQLARLSTGTAMISDTTLTLSGQAANADAYRALLDALKAVPGGTQLASAAIRPPVASPYVWSAERTGSGVTLSGATPSDPVRQASVAAARAAFPGLVIADRQEPASGEPPVYGAAVQAALGALAKLKTGKAALTDSVLTLTGEAESAGIADDIQQLLARARAGGITVNASIDAPAPPPPPPPPPPPEAAAPPPPAAVTPAPVEVRAADAGNATAQQCSAQVKDAIGGRMIHFARGMRHVPASDRPLLQAVADALRGCGKISVLVEGHTDADGDRAFNQRLSRNRAAAVVKALVSAGAPGAALTSAGFGPSRPVAPNVSAADKAKNRRVEIVIR